jgi:hypothetical protein
MVSIRRRCLIQHQGVERARLAVEELPPEVDATRPDRRPSESHGFKSSAIGMPAANQ